MAAWTVYILRCRTGELYTGITNDMDRRLRQHSRGVGSKFTRSRLPVEVVHTEKLSTRSAALKREYAIKRLSRAEKELVVSERTGLRRATASTESLRD